MVSELWPKSVTVYSAQVMDDRVAVEDKLACLKVQYSSLQELISTLKDGKGASKIVEWHGKMEELRLEELKKSRQIQRLSDQVGIRDGRWGTERVFR